MKFYQIIRFGKVRLPSFGAFVLALVLVGCGVPKDEHEQVVERAERARQELETVSEDGARALEELRADLEAEKLRGKETESELEAEVKRLGEEGESASEALEKLKEEFEAYKKSYRLTVRENAKGLSMEELRTLSGEVFRGVNVRSLDARVVSFVHDSGFKSIELLSLEPAFHAVLGYDPRDAEELAASEESGPVVMGPGDVEKITGSWEQLVEEAAKEKAKTSKEIEAKTRKRNEIVAQMKRLNSEIIRLDNAIVRAGRGGSDLRQKKKGLERQYSRLSSQLAQID